MPDQKVFLSVGDEKIDLHGAELICNVRQVEKVEVECLVRYCGTDNWACEREIDLPVLIETLEKIQKTQEPAPVPGILTWDWKGMPDWKDLQKAFKRFTNPTVVEIETGSDSYAIVIGEEGLTQEQAIEFYNAYYSS